MQVGKQYIVTRGSDDGTFEIGDHILLNENGDISCREAGGWLPSEDVEEATKGMKVVIDREWVRERLKKLQEQIDQLKDTQ